MVPDWDAFGYTAVIWRLGSVFPRLSLIPGDADAGLLLGSVFPRLSPHKGDADAELLLLWASSPSFSRLRDLR